jgi:predicted site-specific integrase-resolvase
MSDLLMDAEAAAKEFGVAAKTLLKWARSGKVPHLKLSSRYIRFSRQALTNF